MAKEAIGPKSDLGAAMPPGEDMIEFTALLDTLVEFMTPAQIAEAQQLAREWKPKNE